MQSKIVDGLYLLNTGGLPDPEEHPEWMIGIDEERKERTLRMRHAKDRKQSLGAGLLLRYVLAQYGISMEYIRYGKHGKPEVDGIFFNLSHSHDVAICAVADRSVGCDVEKIGKVPDGIAGRYFSSKENAYLEQFSGEERARAFFKIWTMKESYLKMTGEGLSVRLDRVEMDFEDSGTVYLDGEKCSCHVTQYDLPEYQVTVCAQGNPFAGKLEEISLEI